MVVVRLVVHRVIVFFHSIFGAHAECDMSQGVGLKGWDG